MKIEASSAAEDQTIDLSEKESKANIKNELKLILGKENILDSEGNEAIYTDVYRCFETPICIARPSSIKALQSLAAFAKEQDISLAIRGGGASYTDGYLSNSSSFVLVDLRSLDTIVEINEIDGYVTVESGVTWESLKKELDKRGVRTPFWGPFSGLRATIGGSISQNTISHGSGAYGNSAESIISMDIVLADGRILSTGSASASSAPFLRHFGPDLTGLFTGDCGAFGIKAKITLPLIKKRPSHQCISLAFDDFSSMHESMRRIAAENLEDTHFALDGALSQGQIARQENAGELLKIVFSILKSSPSLYEGLKQLFKSALKAKKVISSTPYMTHYIVEGVHDVEVKARLHRIRELNLDIGTEIPATVPSVVRGMPFAPFYNTLGPKGERWVPLHGILPHSKVTGFHKNLNALYEKHSAKMLELGIWYGGMFGALGSSGFLYEIALYWPDEITEYHRSVVPKEYLEGLPKYPENIEARNFIEALKKDITKLFIKHGAVNFQLGKSYPYLERLLPEAKELVSSIKNTVDPTCIIANDSLGFTRSN